MKRYLLDTNTLLLFLIGGANDRYIGTHRRLRAFSTDDFFNLVAILGDAPVFVTLPQILTEVSNLIGIKDGADPRIVNACVTFILASEELNVDSSFVVRDPSFVRFGLTDAAIITLRQANVHVLTVDYALFGKLSALGFEVTNLRHLENLT